MNDSKHIQLLFFDAGGGHRAATEALKTVLAQVKPNWQVDVVNLQDILKASDPLYILTGVAAQDYYNAALKMGLTYGSRAFLRGLQKVIALCAPRMEETLQSFWRDQNLDAVISLVPNFNQVIFGALRAVHPTTPFVTLMTDMADSPPHFWHVDQDQYIICGTPMAAQQATATGFYRPERIFQTSGMIVRPSFYDVPEKPRLTRSDLGLAEGLPTALVMFGGYGSSIAKTIVGQLNKAKLGVQTIVMCGKNQDLQGDLRGILGCHAAGFTPHVGDYMRLADFFIGKPGPGSLSEAWLMGLPTIVERNARTMIQERPNIAFMEQMGTGIAIPSFRTITTVVRSLMQDGKLETLRANVRKLNNRAVFEVPDLIDHIMQQPVTADIIPLPPRKLAARLAQKWKKKG